MARTIRARRVVVALAIALIGAACSDDAEPNAAEDESAEQTGRRDRRAVSSPRCRTAAR